MSPPAHQQPARGSDKRWRTFAATAADWSAEQFGTWLLRGCCSWHDPRDVEKRTTAFSPAFFDPAQSPSSQVMLLVGQLRDRQALVFRDGLREAIGAWSLDLPHIVLRELVSLAAYYKPIGLPKVLRSYIFGGMLDSAEEAGHTLLELFACLCAYPLTPEVRDLLMDIRRSLRWRTEFAAHFLRALVLAGEMNWLDGLRELRKEFDELSKRVDIATTFDLLITDIGGMRVIARTLFKMFKDKGGDETAADDWIVIALFEGLDPPVRIQVSDEGVFLERPGEDNIYYVDLLGEEEVPDGVEDMRKVTVRQKRDITTDPDDVLGYAQLQLLRNFAADSHPRH